MVIPHKKINRNKGNETAVVGKLSKTAPGRPTQVQSEQG